MDKIERDLGALSRSRHVDQQDRQMSLEPQAHTIYGRRRECQGLRPLGSGCLHQAYDLTLERLVGVQLLAGIQSRPQCRELVADILLPEGPYIESLVKKPVAEVTQHLVVTDPLSPHELLQKDQHRGVSLRKSPNALACPAR